MPNGIREVIALVEGETEMEFINHVISVHLQSHNLSIRPVLSGNPRRTQHGGVRNWANTAKDIQRYLKAGKILTTLFDFYALAKDWPSRLEAGNKPWDQRGITVEQAVQSAITKLMDSSYNPACFVPCIQVHEFESLLFVNPAATALSLATVCKTDATNSWASKIERELTQILTEHNQKAESVNDSPETAPSKRLKKIVNGYDKRAWGYQVVKDVTITELRSGCHWLHNWLSQLEALGQTTQKGDDPI